jgi:hypothetical protein
MPSGVGHDHRIEPSPGLPDVITPPRTADGPLLLADIGGYTAFLRSVQTAHADDAFADGNIPDAYGLVSSLLDGIVERLVPPFTLSKLEGDAVFAYATSDVGIPRGAALTACVAACYGEFHRRLEQAHGVWACRCDACMRIDQLDLKFILHAGRFVIQEIAGTAELVGPEVVMAHRLLKSEAADALGHGAYALLTARAVERFDVPMADGVPMTARYEHYDPIETVLFPLRAA